MNTVPNPQTKLYILRRYLHALSLLQNSNEETNENGRKINQWNASRLASIIKEEEGNTTNVSGKNLQDYIQNHLREEMGLDISTESGGRMTTLASDMDEDLQLKLLNVYSSFVVKDISKDVILKNYLHKHPNDGMWMIAMIYFAVIFKKKIRIDYTTNTGTVMKNLELCPYYMVFRNNNMYLYGWDHVNDIERMLIFNRIENLIVPDGFDNNTSDWPCNKEIPDISERYKDSLSGFIGKKYRVVLHYTRRVENQIDQVINILEPETKMIEDGEKIESVFSISDGEYLCKQLLLYGTDAEIVEPPELRTAMIEMLKTSLSVYEK